METQQLLAKIEALPEQARVTIEQLVILLSQQPLAAKMPPVFRPATPPTDEENQAEQPENLVADAVSQGGQADWDAPDFDFREWRRQIWERPKAQL